MNNNLDTSIQADNTNKETDSLTVIPVKSMVKSINVFALIFSLIAITAAGYSFWANLFKLYPLTQTQYELLKNNTEELQSQVNYLTTKLDQQKNSLLQIQTQWNQFDKSNSILWQAKSLVQQADLLLQSGYQITTAINLLKTANQYLKKTNNDSWQAITIAIDNDIQTLNQLPIVDVVSVFQEFAVVKQEITQSLISRPDSSKAKINQALIFEHPENLWQKILNYFKQVSTKLITISYTNDSLPAQLTQAQEIYLKQELQFFLAEAQWALIQNNAQIYQISLQQLVENLNNYSNRQPTQFKVLLAHIHHLQQVDLNPQLPNLAETLSLINNTLNSQKSSIPR